MFEMNLIMLMPHFDVLIVVLGFPDQNKNKSWHKTVLSGFW